jgi:peptidoglycan hydrolase-like protein with peptidoglycan-binding domain
VKSKRLQRRLGELGYYHRVVDGVMGPRTRAAIAAYESTHNLVVDGMITPRLSPGWASPNR